MMKKTQVLLKKLRCTVIVASLLTLCVQPSYSLEATAWRSPHKQEISTKNLRQAEAHNNRGVELAGQGRYLDAIAAFNQAIEIYPNYENAHNNLGLALGSQKQFSEAADAFKHALSINPVNFETYNNLGIALGSQGKFSEAIAAFKQAIQIKPNDPTSHQNLALAFWSGGKKPEAITSLHKAKQLYSLQNNPEGINHIEEILQQLEIPKKGARG